MVSKTRVHLTIDVVIDWLKYSVCKGSWDAGLSSIRPLEEYWNLGNLRPV